MNWAALAVALSLAQTAIYVGTAAVALAQLREARRARQFDTTRAVIAHAFDPLFYRAVQFIFRDLDARLRDPAYAAELASARGWDVDAERHPELVVLARLEEIGTYVKYGHVAEAALFENLAALITGVRGQLAEVVRLSRGARPGERVSRTT